jgi:SAM-dependent methyltransferase
MTQFNLYSLYYDLLYGDKNYFDEVQYILNQLSPNTDLEILELGCGSGGHAEILCTKGNKVVGIDLSEGMIDRAKQKQIQGFEPLVGNIVSFNFSKKFDCVISMFHVMSYLTDNKDLSSCFFKVNNHLHKNGLFIFDFWYGPAVLFQKPSQRIKEIEDSLIYVKREAIPNINTLTNVVEVNFKIDVTEKRSGKNEFFEELHPMRYFSIPELEFMGEQTGFELVKTEELITCNTPSETTWGVCAIFRKR